MDYCISLAAGMGDEFHRIFTAQMANEAVAENFQKFTLSTIATVISNSNLDHRRVINVINYTKKNGGCRNRNQWFT